MTYRDILIEEARKRGVSEDTIAAAFKQAIFNVGNCEEKEVPADKVEQARRDFNLLMDLVKKMSPAQKDLTRSVLYARAASKAKNN